MFRGGGAYVIFVLPSTRETGTAGSMGLVAGGRMPAVASPAEVIL